MGEETKQKQGMTREEAEAKLKEWGDVLEVATDLDFFKDAAQELALPVMKGRLDFNPDNETFSYLLIKPLKRTNSTKEMITISEGNFEKIKVIDRYKDSERAGASAALFARHTGLIISEVDEMCERDINKINAVITGFFGQTKSSK